MRQYDIFKFKVKFNQGFFNEFKWDRMRSVKLFHEPEKT